MTRERAARKAWRQQAQVQLKVAIKRKRGQRSQLRLKGKGKAEGIIVEGWIMNFVWISNSIRVRVSIRKKERCMSYWAHTGSVSVGVNRSSPRSEFLRQNGFTVPARR